MAEHIVQSFRTLGEPVERTRALRLLVAALSSEERQITSAAISERNDVITRLPIELVLAVFSYLDLRAVWCLQIVNRRWRQMLSSDQVLRTALARWDTHDIARDSGRSQDVLNQATILDKIRHIRALEEARPFTSAMLHETGVRILNVHAPASQPRFGLSRDKISYISSKPGKEDVVCVYDLVTGTTKSLRGEAREQIGAVVITPALTAFVASLEGSLYVAGHSDLSTLRVSLPSAIVRTLGADDKMVSLALGTASPASPYVTTVLLYNAETHELQSFPVEHVQKTLETTLLERTNSCGIIVDSKSRTIDVLTLLYLPPSDHDMAERIAIEIATSSRLGASDNTDHDAADSHLVISHFRLNFRGEVLSNPGPQLRRIPCEQLVERNTWQMAPPHRTGQKDEFLIRIRRTGGRSPMSFHFSLTFDISTLLFRDAADLRVRIALRTRPPSARLLERTEPTTSVPWKGRLIDVDQGLSYCDTHQIYAAINDTFLVSVQSARHAISMIRIHIFCFDEGELFGRRDCGYWKRLEGTSSL